MATNLNNTTPSAPAGSVNVSWQTDGAGNDSAYVVNAGGVNVQTSAYTIVAADCGKLVVCNSGSAVTFKLPVTPPFAKWSAQIQNIGAGTMTLNPNGPNLDGASSSVTLATGAGIVIFTDGTNYFSERGSASGGGSGVSSLNSLTGSLSIVAGTGITVTPSGSNITVSASGGGGGTSWQNTRRETFWIADGSTTTLQFAGDVNSSNLITMGPALTALSPTSTRGAALEVAAGTGGSNSVIIGPSNQNYRTGRHIKLLADLYISTTGDSATWIYIGTPSTTGNNLSGIGWNATPGAGGGACSYAGFRCFNRSGSSLETTWQAATGDGSSDNIQDTGVTQDTAMHQFAIVFDDANTQVLFYIDGTLVATSTTSLPASGNNLMLYVVSRYATTPVAAGIGSLRIASDI